MMTPSVMLYRVYATKSLRNSADGVRFEIVNRLMNIPQVSLRCLLIDGEPQPMDRVRLETPGVDGAVWIEAGQSFSLPLNAKAVVLVAGLRLPKGAHTIGFGIAAPPFGEMQFTVEDAITEDAPDSAQAETAAPAECATMDTAVGAAPVLDHAENAEPGTQDSFDAAYEAGVCLLASSMETCLEAQKELLNMAIQRAEKMEIVVGRGSEFARNAVAGLTASFEELARSSVENFAAAGRLFLAPANRRPPGPPEGTGT